MQKLPDSNRREATTNYRDPSIYCCPKHQLLFAFFRILGGTLAKTMGAWFSNEHPCNHLSVQKSVLLPFPISVLTAIAKRGNELGCEGSSRSFQGRSTRVFFCRCHLACSAHAVTSRLVFLNLKDRNRRLEGGLMGASNFFSEILAAVLDSTPSSKLTRKLISTSLWRRLGAQRTQSQRDTKSKSCQEDGQ